MLLKDTVSGQIVNIFVCSNNMARMTKEEAMKDGGYPIATHIIEVSDDTVFCGWKENEKLPSNFHQELRDEWEKVGYVTAIAYNPKVECELIGNHSSGIASRLERPCKTCKRNNDIGVSKCWCCEIYNP
jgi:hypothetical protein